MKKQIWMTIVLLLIIVVSTSACDVRRTIMREIARQNVAYFSPPGTDGWEVEQLTDHVYTFRWSWYRNIFVVTDEGVFATDPFNPEAAALLRDAIREKAGNKPVKYLFYTHYHHSAPFPRGHLEAVWRACAADPERRERCERERGRAEAHLGPLDAEPEIAPEPPPGRAPVPAPEPRG